MKHRALAIALLLAGCSSPEPREKPPTPPRSSVAGGTPAGVTREVTTESGLRYEDIVIGTGPSPSPGQTAVVHYVGTFPDGEVFDTSRKRGKPFSFPLGRRRVIAGWDEGVASMRVGGKRRLICPPDLAYGHEGSGPIPPDATLHFEVELLDVR